VNILTDPLPLSVTISGVECPINTDFRAALRCILAFEDDTLTAYEKQTVMLCNLYPQMPPDALEAMKQAAWFLNGGRESDDSAGGPRVYSFGKDANLIYAAFRATHNINLKEVDLHWWEFLALFLDLGSETTFCNLVSLRKRIKTGKATKEERRAALEMGELFDVPDADDRTIEQREAERRFDEAVAEGMRKRDGR
jgi:hypothetical protein